MEVAYMYPPKPIAGSEAIVTKVMSHPIVKEMTKAVMNMDIVIMRVAIFSPIAYWKAKESFEKSEESYDCLFWSNHPISWRSKLLRYSFLLAIPCLSPVMIQHANIPHPEKIAPIPIYKK